MLSCLSFLPSDCLPLLLYCFINYIITSTIKSHCKCQMNMQKPYTMNFDFGLGGTQFGQNLDATYNQFSGTAATVSTQSDRTQQPSIDRSNQSPHGGNISPPTHEDLDAIVDTPTMPLAVLETQQKNLNRNGGHRVEWLWGARRGFSILMISRSS